jgi:hypothetical protein
VWREVPTCGISVGTRMCILCRPKVKSFVGKPPAIAVATVSNCANLFRVRLHLQIGKIANS